jgi:hypothetical protein
MLSSKIGVGYEPLHLVLRSDTIELGRRQVGVLRVRSVVEVANRKSRTEVAGGGRRRKGLRGGRRGGEGGGERNESNGRREHREGWME